MPATPPRSVSFCRRLLELPIVAVAVVVKLLLHLTLTMPITSSAVRAVTRRVWPRLTPSAAFTSSSHRLQPAPSSWSASASTVDPYANSPVDPHSFPKPSASSSSPSPPPPPPTSSSSSSGTTHFGYTDVPVTAKQSMVADVFHRVASTYDLMNDVMSVGIHRLWKHRLLSLTHPTAHTQLLDVAGGTGDIAFRFIENVRALPLSPYERQVRGDAAVTASVVVCDINPSMLQVGRDRAIQYGYLDASAPSSFSYPPPQPSSTPPSSSSASSSTRSSPRVGLSFVEGNAESLPFPSDTFDVYTIAFGLRNVTEPARALSEAHRVLKRGGVMHCLEFSQVEVPLLGRAYDAYSFAVIPVLGEVVAGDRPSYEYLVQSIRKWKGKEELVGMMKEAGFSGVRYENLSLGIACIHSGYKL